MTEQQAIERIADAFTAPECRYYIDMSEDERTLFARTALNAMKSIAREDADWPGPDLSRKIEAGCQWPVA